MSHIYREANDSPQRHYHAAGSHFLSIRVEKERDAVKVDAWERYETIGDNANDGCPPYTERHVHIYRYVGGDSPVYRKHFAEKGTGIVTY